jgi:hypothetical protein
MMRSSQISSAASTDSVQQRNSSIETESNQQNGYQWTALSVTTVGALLASIQGSALLIALPNILTELQATFFTIMLATSQCKNPSYPVYYGTYLRHSQCGQ